MSTESGPPTVPVPSSGAATGSSSLPAAAAGGVPEKRSSELDEFLARAVDRQIAEQRALRETLQQLGEAVKELQARPAPAPALAPPPAIDVADLDARVKRTMDANTQTFTNEIRDLRSTMLPSLERAMESTQGVRAIEHDLSILRDAVSGLSADVEGIAQALIDLNGGLRDWAEGVDRNVETVREAVQQVREVATRAEELQAETLDVVEERLDRRPLVAEAELIEVDETGVIPMPAPQGTAIVAQRDVSTEIEQRMKETIELSLYLADQIEAFDKAIGNLGDLPTKLEGVISQALKRTLAARAKLDREAEMALDEVVATLDEHVENIGDLASAAQTVKDLTTGQADLASGIEALAQAIDRSSDGRAPRAAASLPKTTKRTSAAAAKTSGKKSPAKGGAAKRGAKASSSKKRAPSAATKKRAAARRKATPKASYRSLDDVAD